MKCALVIIKILFISSYILLSTGLKTEAQGLHIGPTNSINLGVFAAESDQTACFEITNSSTQTIFIRKVESCCAYIQPVVYVKKIEPGKSIPLDALIDSNSLYGKFRKKIDVETSAEDGSFSLWIEGTARPAIMPSTDRISIGRLSLNQPWSTNIAVRTRHDIQGTPIAKVQSSTPLAASVSKLRNNSFNLELTLPAKPQPVILKGTVLLSIDGKPGIRPVSIPLEGCIGGSLHTVPKTLVIDTDSNGTVGFTLYRYAPESVRLLDSPLYCSNKQVRLEEKKKTAERSEISLRLSPDLLHKLKQKERIPLEFSSEGFVPATLMLMLAP